MRRARGRGLRIAVSALAICVVASVGAAAARAPGGRAARPAPELLPDFDQIRPQNVSAISRRSPAGRRFLLVFGSAVANVGAGPLLLEGRRPSRAVPEMAVSQMVRRADGPARRYPLPAVMRYVRAETHAHWHLLGFMRYELRAANTGASLGRDRKTGFCLGDRFVMRGAEGLPGKPRRAVWRGQCGRRRPDLLVVRRGISVGFGDSYRPTFEGQYIDVTSVPPGRYLLVHRANPDGSVRERNHANNASSVLLRLRWPRGRADRPRVDVLAECPDTDRCPAPA